MNDYSKEVSEICREINQLCKFYGYDNFKCIHIAGEVRVSSIDGDFVAYITADRMVKIGRSTTLKTTGFVHQLKIYHDFYKIMGRLCLFDASLDNK